ncbi:alcohol dehydrogenase [Reticulibacter mediterranei]|uniref:Alcohol dehydrogenase n=1 Tax=Reticulibacter mediterranei TaxID=2778369 RepID=A0A8J3INP0_9CHLR|nr:alcohol dehydrogenase [Reticulibacter mediterranei]GHO97901.1 alcohol dehydrogenase [Reticulibacter mediterranei]
MSQMKAVQVSQAGGAFELVERPIPEPQENQVRIKVEACGVCHSDSIVKEGGGGVYPITYPRIPGHEVIGAIDAVGKDVHSWSVGQRVGVGWHGGHDFVCVPCRRGDFINCQHAQITGISYDGGYAEYMVVPQEALALVPEQLNAADAAPLLCAGITTFNALRHSVAKPGDLVAVQGLGGLGHLGVQFANRFGFRTVAVSRGKDKERLARELGADEYIDTEASDPVQELLRMGGARVVLTTAPSGKAIASIIGGVGVNGQLLVVAAPGDATDLYLASLISGTRSIQGWASGTAMDSEDTLNFSTLRGVLPLVETFPLERADEAYHRMMSNQVRFRAVLTP